MNLIKGSSKLIYLFKAFYIYLAYVFINEGCFLLEQGDSNRYLVFTSLAVSILSIFFTRSLILRAIVFFSSFKFFLALYNFEHATHAWHFMIYISFLLIFIDNTASTKNIKDLFSFWSIQFAILFTYSLSGFYKLAASLVNNSNNIGYFSLEAIPNLIAYKMLEINHQVSPIAQFFIDHRFVSLALGAAAVFIELFSILIFFYPKLLRTWGLLLICIHLFALIVLKIDFEANMIACFLFLVMNPLKNLKHSNRSLFLRLLPNQA